MRHLELLYVYVVVMIGQSVFSYDLLLTMDNVALKGREKPSACLEGGRLVQEDKSSYSHMLRYVASITGFLQPLLGAEG